MLRWFIDRILQFAPVQTTVSCRMNCSFVPRNFGETAEEDSNRPTLPEKEKEEIFLGIVLYILKLSLPLHHQIKKDGQVAQLDRATAF